MPSPHRPRRAAPFPPATIEVLAYILLACLLCWFVATPALLGALPAGSAPVVVPLAQLTPLLATVPFFRWYYPGRPRDLFALAWNRSGWWVVVGIGILTAISATQLSLGLALGWQLRPGEGLQLAALTVLPALVLQAAFAFGEEAGWRGWLVSRTLHLGFLRMAALSALVWAAWQLPILLLLPQVSPAQTVAYLLSTASMAPFLVALRLVSGSIWPAVFTHGAINSVRVFFLQSVADSGGVTWTVEVMGWVLCLLAAWALIQHAEARLP